MKKINICRPIIFYNNFVPPIKEVQEWKYCAFGTLDGIDVEKNIARENEQILSSIWKHQREFCEKLNGKYMAQVIYAVKYDEWEKDHVFWGEETDSEYPFTFFTRIQCNGDVKTLWEKRTAFQERLDCLSHVKASVYLTYDNSDFIIILKTDTYTYGAAIVNTLRQGGNLIEESGGYSITKNSFTVFAVRQSIINTCENLCINDKIHQVEIRFIEKQGKGIAKIEERMSANVEKLTDVQCIRKQVLGTDDEVITFFNIPWKTFLSFYKNKTGILNNANEDYNQFILGTTAVIMEQAGFIDELLTVSDESVELAKEWRQQEVAQSRKYGRYIDNLVIKLKTIKDLEEKSLCKSLDIVVNSLAKFKQPAFSDYLFLTIIRPMDCLLDLIIANAKRGTGAKFNNRNAYLDFIKSFNMYTQNSIRSDRHSMQVMDLNVKIYDIPVMLNVFYNAYLYRICGLLNKCSDETEYNFFVMPGMGYKVNVQELYKRVEEKRRLMKAEIPEHKYFDMKGTMIVLAHEVAHYVGREIRKREYRYQNYIQNIAHIYIVYIVHMYQKYEKKPIIIEFDIESLEERMRVILSGAMERETRKDYLEKNKVDTQYYLEKNINYNIIDKTAEERKKYQFYISFIKEYSGNAILGVMLYCLQDVFAPVIYKMEKREADEFIDLIYQITERFISEYPEKSTALSMKTATESLIMMYEECFADLMSILLLQLTPEEYIQSFAESALEQGISEEDITNYNYVFRIMFIAICMIEPGDTLSWNMEEIEALMEKPHCNKIVKELVVLCKLYYNEGEKYYENQYFEKNCTNIFKDRKIIESISDYLIECKREYFAIKNKNYTRHDEEMLAVIQDLYQSSKEGIQQGIEQQMIKQLEFIENYKQNLLVDWDVGENI